MITQLIPLTPRQASLLRTLAQSIDRHGEAPTLAEAAASLDIKRAAVQKLLRGLERRGYVRRIRFIERGIELTSGGRAWADRFAAKPMPEAIALVMRRGRGG